MNRILISCLIIIFMASLSCASKKVAYNLRSKNAKKIATGLEIFLKDHASDYYGKKAALVTNHSGVNFQLDSNLLLLRKQGIEIPFVLAPEHGIYGYQNEYDENIYFPDDNLNIIVYNIHKLNTQSLRHLLKITDIIIFDIQDMGMRCYTYISSLKFIMDSIAGSNIELIVLDRPNPLSFIGVDGPFLDQKFYSKNISSFPVPFMYNMTIGELALYYNGEFTRNVLLNVIELKGYRRKMLYNDTLLPWVPPSPNLPSYMSSIIYSATVLLEGINISLGRGTANPFEFIGAPWIEPMTFCASLNRLDFKSFNFRPIYFKPTFSKYKNIKCGGAQIFYTGGEFSPVEISYKLIQYIMNTYPQFQWETFKEKYNIDYLSGTDEFRIAVAGNKNFEEFLKSIKKRREWFEDKREDYLLYWE